MGWGMTIGIYLSEYGRNTKVGTVIRFCTDLRHGEIERLSIQDGLPVLAEITKKKVKFHGRSQQSAAT